MLNILYILIVLFVGALSVTWLVGVLWPNPSAGEIEVRLSPEEAIKEMTVNEFEALARDYLVAEGYEVDESGQHLTAVRDTHRYHVEFDFEAKADNPRAINGMMVEQKKRDSDRMILFTLASVDGQARQIADSSGIEIVEPDTIIGWERDSDSDASG
jgi:hypothetical protein